MAKNFKIRITSKAMCEDLCSFLNDGTYIGSVACKNCINKPVIDLTSKRISCPKIIYRHANNTVIMRKK